VNEFEGIRLLVISKVGESRGMVEGDPRVPGFVATYAQKSGQELQDGSRDIKGERNKIGRRK
jgi:hypothetical protein